MIALIVVALGAVIAAVGTGMLAARATGRPRIYFLAWAVALFGLAIGLGATTLGYVAGFDSLMFRAMELGAQLIAPLALCVALVEVIGRRLASRFAMRLAVTGIAVIALVILGTDPVSPNMTFTSKWPDPAFYYQLAPLTVLGFLTLFTAITAGASLVVMLVRSSREQLPSDETRPSILVALAGLAVALPGLVWLLAKFGKITLPLPEKDVFAASCAAAAVLVWYSARMAGNRDLGQAPSEAAARTRGDWDEGGPRTARSGPAYEAGGFDEFDEFGSQERIGSHRASATYNPHDPRDHDEDAGYFDNVGSDYRYPGLAALVEGPEPPDEPERDADSWLPGVAGPYGDVDRYGPVTGQYEGPNGFRDPEPHAPMFGQITIYALMDGRAEDFDRLTEWVVAQVQSREPDTLVYIVHAVPTAPMQRILYEVYRDRAAYNEHLSRSYVMTYETEQRSLVMAANVIELGVQQAKVSPLPSMSAISDILSESGIDLTGVTRSSHSGGASRSRGYHRSPSGRAQDYREELPPEYGHRDAADEFGDPSYDRPYSGWADMRGEDPRY